MTEVPPKGPYANLDVLVVDPSPHMASLIAIMLRTLKVREIREKNTVSQAMTALRRRSFGILILDDAFRDVGSVDFVRQLRANETCRNRNIPIIMLSAQPGPAQIAAARDAGVTEFLRKPFSAAHLKTRLDSILRAPREFIAAPNYAGPDRRRQKGEFRGKDRRGTAERKSA